MSQIKLSKDACLKTIEYSQDTYNQLNNNINVLNRTVDAQFRDLKDPTFQKFMELNMQLESMLKQVGNKMEDISQYCQSIIRWIDNYNQY